MPSDDEKRFEVTGVLKGNVVSRREFLKVAGMAGATIGLGAGLAGLVAACGGTATTTTGATTATTEAATSTTGAATETTAATTATTAAPVDTTVASSAEVGREIKIGYVAPLTGPLAAMAIPDKYCWEHFEKVVGDGLVLGDGKKHPISVQVQDGQSDSNRASQVAGDLINNSKVDLMTTAGSPDIVVPVADQAEANSAPCICTDCPWEAWFFTRGGKPTAGFKWTYLAYWGAEDNYMNYFNMWDQLQTNKVVGAMWANDADGQTNRTNWPKPMATAGYTLIDGGAYQPGMEDYTSIIDKFKKGGAELVCGLMSPGDFTNFYKQIGQQSFHPKFIGVGKAINFPQTVDALGDSAIGLSTTVWWHPTYPFKSALTGENCRQHADNYEAAMGVEWSMPLLHFSVFEWAADVLKRTTDLDDKNKIIEAVSTTKLDDTVCGPIDFTAKVGSTRLRPVPNVVRTPIAAGQWGKSNNPKWKHDLFLLSNVNWPMIPVSGKMTPLSWSNA
jgi:branched-chain amino acid transport system substrate-binding protein